MTLQRTFGFTQQRLASLPLVQAAFSARRTPESYEKMRTGSFVLTPNTKSIIRSVAATVFEYDRSDFNDALYVMLKVCLDNHYYPLRQLHSALQIPR